MISYSLFSFKFLTYGVSAYHILYLKSVYIVFCLHVCTKSKNVQIEGISHINENMFFVSYPKILYDYGIIIFIRKNWICIIIDGFKNIPKTCLICYHYRLS